MSAGSPELQTDLTPADWVIGSIRPDRRTVGSIVPEGFKAYARIFHPALRCDHGASVLVRWSEIATAKGRTVHSEMQWPRVSGVWEFSGEDSPGLWNREPDVGTLPRSHASRLADLLRRHTLSPDRVWFCVWHGWGGLNIAPGGTSVLTSGRHLRRRPAVQPVPPAPTVQILGRSYYLLSGSIDSVTESMTEPPSWQSANLWWPEDRAWCVATAIDLATTYVAGSEFLIQRLSESPELEALQARIDDGIFPEADRINPPIPHAEHGARPAP